MIVDFVASVLVIMSMIAIVLGQFGVLPFYLSTNKKVQKHLEKCGWKVENGILSYNGETILQDGKYVGPKFKGAWFYAKYHNDYYNGLDK